MSQQTATPRPRPGVTGPRPGPQQAPAPRVSRMTLGSVRKGVRPAPDRIVLYGTEGVGKSTFAAGAPSPIFLCAEDGVRHLDVASFPEPKTFGDVLDALATLAAEPHEYKTLAVDTIDWIEPLIWSDLCQRNGWGTIEDAGYGKGFLAAGNEWRRFILGLERVRNERGMEIILLAHAAIRAHKNPNGLDYMRHGMKLHKLAEQMMSEWCDAVLFACHEEVVQAQRGATVGKRVTTGRRIIRTEQRDGWDAKNRHGLPEELPLDYAAYAEARAAGQPAPADAMVAEIRALMERIQPSDAARAAIETRLAAAAGDAAKLAVLTNTLLDRLAQQQEAAPSGEATTTEGQ